MNKWLFSNEGQVVGPLNEAEAKSFVEDNPDVYVWQPSFGQWQPISHVPNFLPDESIPKPPATLTSEIIENFHGKETRLLETLERVNKTLRVSANTVAELNDDIEKYHGMTKNLIVEVKSAIQTINNQHKALQESLAGVTKSNTPHSVVGQD